MASKKVKSKKKAAAFYVGSWRGRPNYTCLLCPMVTLDQAGFVAHMRGHGVDIVNQEPDDTAQDEPELPAEVDNG